ncbi:MAG: DUF4252 domain-containing protein [Acidobacteria bacterium]|nr:MAG: DUF4252 domain-containing protein [Acidobacteriota bacterium]
MKILTGFTGKQTFTRALPTALLASCLMAFGATAAWAQNARLELSQLDRLASKASEVANVSLEGPMLKMAAEQMSKKAATAKSQNKAFAANMVQRLKGIYVKSFEFDQPGGYSKADLEGVTKQLESGGWKSIVHVEEKKSGETTGIYVMQEGGATVGMAIVAAEPKELTVVNLVGPIDFSQLGSLGSLGALGQLGGLAGAMGSSKPELQDRQATTPKAQADSK